MEPSEYWDAEPQKITITDEQEKQELVKKTYNEFMDNLELVADMVSAFPPSWQLQMLVGIMRDI